MRPADHIGRVIELSTKQLAEQQFWGHVDHLISSGGRGGGKTTGLIFAGLRHADELGPDCNAMFTREGHGDYLELFTRTAEYAGRIWGGVDTNRNDGTIKIGATGATLHFTNLSEQTAMNRALGRSITALLADEVGNYSPAAYANLQMLRTNIRPPLGARAIEWWTANPFGRSHGPIYKNHICRAPFWRPYRDAAGRSVVNTFSTYRDNAAIDQEQYRRQLEAGCPTTELRSAWVDGVWQLAAGQLFSSFDPAVNILAQTPACDYYRLGGDWGASAPAVCLLLGQVAANTRGFAPGSIVVCEEVDTAEDPTDLNIGNGMVPVAFAEMVVERCLAYGYRHPSGVMDDARGLMGDTVIDLMRSGGVCMRKPYKRDRVGAWNLINQMFANAKTGDGPGLYISNRCPHLIETIAEAPRGVLRPEDIDPKYLPNHWIDALGYGVKDFHGGKVKFGRTVGT